MKFNLKSLALAFVGAGLTAIASAQYQAVKLTPGGFVQVPLVSGKAGQQIGTGPNTHAILWSGTAGSAVDLNPTFTAFSQGAAVGDGQQVGFGGPLAAAGQFGGNTHALLWSGSSASAVDLNPNANSASMANACAGGQQVGIAWTLGGSIRGQLVQPGPNHAILWQGTAASAIDLNPGSVPGQVYAIQSSEANGVSGGRQVGVVFIPGGGAHAVVWQGSAANVTDINPFFAGGSVANAISGVRVVGSFNPVFAANGIHAVYWPTPNSSQPIDLDPGIGYGGSEALAVSDSQQAGYAFKFDPAGPFNPTFQGNGFRHAIVWQGSSSSFVDLNQFLPPGYTDAVAYGVDAQGNVIGSAIGPNTNSFGLPDAFVWKLVTPQTPVNAAGVSLSQTSLVAGDAPTVTVNLTGPAPAGGTVVALATDDPNETALAQSITVPAGATSGQAQLDTAPSTQATQIRVYAAAGDTTVVATAQVAPVLSISGLSLSPPSVVGPGAATGTVTLNRAAPTGGAVVNLSSSLSLAASVPASITIPSGATSSTFSIAASSVAQSEAVTITASINGLSRTGSFTVFAATVSVTKAEYVVSQNQLNVEALSTSITDTLRLTVTSSGQLIGTMTNVGGGKFQLKGTWPSNPVNVTATNAAGVSGSLNITLK